ncbi:MAG: translation initiation factor IF-2, partial [Proteiniphilum sp.]|nr:translation initiation factor IF-2 [Proteiniphilum sp.]
MPIRLIKVSKNLNVGINTLVEFLHKKGIEVEANPNAKIEDEQYNILIAEFGKDKNIRLEATETREKMHRRDEKRETVAIEGYELPEEQAPKKKVEKEVIETEIPAEMKPHFNVVGSIDLDNLAKTKSEPEQPTSPIPAEEHEKEQNVIPEEPEVTIAPEAETKEQPLAEDKKPTTPEKPADAAPPIEAEKPAATVETTTDEPATKAGQTHEDEAVPAEETVMQGRESVDTEENETASVADDAGKDITPTQPVAEE